MSADSLFAQYNTWLLGSSALRVVAPCTDIELLDQLRQRILEEPDLHDSLHNDAFMLIASSLQDKADLLSALRDLTDAFQTLEQAALHLYLTPWRKEFHTIKTFSGHYVHVLEAALPQDAIFQALKKLGYEPQEDGTCLTIRVQPAPRTLLGAALGFLAAQLECRILADIVVSSGSALVNGTDLICERRSWRGYTTCMERLKKLILEDSGAPNPKSPATIDIYESGWETTNGEAPLYQPQFCIDCHEPWDQHVDRPCRVVNEHLVHSKHPESHLQLGEYKVLTLVPQVIFALHDCVFNDESLDQRCAECCLLHSSSCSAVRGCKDLGHRLTQLSPSEKLDAVMEEQRKKHQLHFCLQPGHLPHYRCGNCRQLHYINCKEVSQCRSQGHNANMIMLEKDQRLWLQRSLMDLKLLCKNIPAQSQAGI